jgi:hypothetical protein
MCHRHSHFGGRFGSFDARLSHGGFDGFGFGIRQRPRINVFDVPDVRVAGHHLNHRDHLVQTMPA